MNKVVIKSNKYGIDLVLDDQTPFPELLQMIAEKFDEAGDFFKDTKMAVSFEGRVLAAKEEQAIADTIMEHSDIKIVSIIDSRKDLEELMKERVEAYEESRRYSEQATYGSSGDMIDMDIPPVGDFYKGNLRSGQTLECASSVTLIGDVNPGAKIISGGNIVVLGSMKGNAHAGASGDGKCFIFALDMRPIQLQIGDLIAKSPDGEQEGWRAKRRGRASQGQYFAQIAVVRDDCICIEPMTKGCLDRL